MDTNVHTHQRHHRGIVQMSAWAAIAALAWQAIRTAARTRRLEHLTHAWHIAESPPAHTDQHC
jgi:hypothetical protein